MCPGASGTDRGGRPRTGTNHPERPGYPFVAALTRLLTTLDWKRSELESAVLPTRRKWLNHAGQGDRPISASDLAALLAWPGLSEAQRLDLKLADIHCQINFGRPRHTPRSCESRDLIGIGALNYDYVIPLSVSGRQRKRSSRFTSQPEQIVSSEAAFIEYMNEAARKARGNPATVFTHELGGSAFNVLRLVAMCRLSYHTGFVGVSGESPLPRLPTHYRLCMDVLGIDVRCMEPSLEPAGRCLSVVHSISDDEIQRDMGTWPAANEKLYGYLVDNFWPIVDYLSAARVVHVTSLLDDGSPEVLADILEQAIARRPDLVVSFDPGHVWATEPREAVARILAMTTLLFANEQELVALSKTYGGTGGLGAEEPDHAANVLDTMPDRGGAVVVVKHRGATSVYGKDSPAVKYRLGRLADKNEDDTGAGDAFAAGYLAAYMAEATADAAQLGMQFARAKLAQVGPPPPRTVQSLANAALKP